jgi:hypothetical protein
VAPASGRRSSAGKTAQQTVGHNKHTGPGRGRQNSRSGVTPMAKPAIKLAAQPGGRGADVVAHQIGLALAVTAGRMNIADGPAG